MSKDLSLLYIFSTCVYITVYLCSLALIESTVLKRVVRPILEVTERIRNPMKLRLEYQT